MASSILQAATDQTGTVLPKVVSDKLKVTDAELALALGLSCDAVFRKSQQRSVATQRRLLDVIEILDRVIPWAGSEFGAFAWYRSQPLPSFGGQTAEDLAKAGRAEAVSRYLDRVAEGGFG